MRSSWLLPLFATWWTLWLLLPPAARAEAYAIVDPDGIGEVRGQVFELHSGRPVDALAVHIAQIHGGRDRRWPEPWVADLPDDVPIARLLTDPAGVFSFRGLRPGHYRVELSAGGPGDSDAEVFVREGSTVHDVTLRFAVGTTVRGRVTDEHGAPMGQVGVWIVGVDDGAGGNALLGETALPMHTDPEGRFRLVRTPPGRLWIQAGRRRFGFSAPVLVVPHPEDEDVTITLPVPDERLTLDIPRDQDGGLGIELDFTPLGPVIHKAIPEKPAALAGLDAGDRILAVGGRATRWMSRAELTARCRGLIGSAVTVRIESPGVAARDVQLVRARLPGRR